MKYEITQLVIDPILKLENIIVSHIDIDNAGTIVPLVSTVMLWAIILFISYRVILAVRRNKDRFNASNNGWHKGWWSYWPVYLLLLFLLHCGIDKITILIGQLNDI